MKKEPDFPLLFKQIGNYLKTAREHPRELQMARKAFLKIHRTIYGKEPFGKCPTAAVLNPRTRTTSHE